MLLLLVIESKSKNGSDSYYIKSIIDRFYSKNHGHKLEYIPMNGKGNYNSQTVCNKIQVFKSRYQGECKVIYFYDRDLESTNNEQKKLNEEINNHCKNHLFDSVWFCRNIEEVFLGKLIIKDKKKVAENFFYNDKINEVEKSHLQAKSIIAGYSNILLIFDKYFQKK